FNLLDGLAVDHRGARRWSWTILTVEIFILSYLIKKQKCMYRKKAGFTTNPAFFVKSVLNIIGFSY
ncbi:hypothetical protein, partial [Neobacillus cucumis]|uniref:hypothetical protein n=1 Tax=Neobacillus cucumis TaxID=1740721 RepID=UPI001C60BE46